jgi:hypothetical protein
MDKAAFWRLIEDAKKESKGDCPRQAEILAEKLAALPAEEIIEFDKILDEHRSLAYTWDLWAAAYIINGGCSDDCFDYFGGWLIAQGEAVFHGAVRDPETLADLDIHVHVDEPSIECEDMLYVAQKAYEAKTGNEMPMREWNRGEPAGEEWDEDTVDEKYPKLAAKFWG